MKNKRLWVILIIQVSLAVITYSAVLLLSHMGLSSTTRLVTPAIICGSDRILVRATVQFHWSNRLNSLQIYWNNRLVDMQGELRTQPNKLLLPRPVTGSGLNFYPVFAKPHELQQIVVGSLVSTGPTFTVWVNPAHFSKAEFVRMGECFKSHKAIGSILRVAGPSRNLVSSRKKDVAPAGVLIYADVQKFINQTQEFSSSKLNSRGGSDLVVIRANGAVDLIRRDDVSGYRISIGRLVIGSGYLNLTLNDEFLAELPYGPMPTLMEISQYKNEKGQTLGHSFMLVDESSRSYPEP